MQNPVRTYWHYLLVLLYVHLLFIHGLFVHWGSITWLHVAGFFTCWTLISGLGIGVGYHRLISHRSFTTSRFWEVTCSFLGMLGLQGSPNFWSAVHKYHHRNADKRGDPHSPVEGRWYSYFGWIGSKRTVLYVGHAKRRLQDSFQYELDRNYESIVILTVVIAILVSFEFATLCLAPAMLLTLHQEFCVNLFCHTQGGKFKYRNYDTPDNTSNCYLFGLLFWGVGYHNNHHAHPERYDFGHTRYEIDFTKYLVRLIQK